jgi:hypothetical protein
MTGENEKTAKARRELTTFCLQIWHVNPYAMYNPGNTRTDVDDKRERRKLLIVPAVSEY